LPIDDDKIVDNVTFLVSSGARIENICAPVCDKFARTFYYQLATICIAFENYRALNMLPRGSW